ncbi:MAG TPA: GNAT family N-acetyltransferase [Pyrinomonadaceae bacterium]|nr:GNAT family N-acetyltransferase [Pyrinomonadaceae bacterium]
MVRMNSTELQHIVLTRPPDEDLLAAWNDLLLNCDHASHFTTPDFFEDPFVGRGERFAVLVFNGDQIDGAVTGLKDGRHIQCGLPVRPQTAFRDGANFAAVFEQFALGLEGLGGADTELVDVYSWTSIGEKIPFGFEENRCRGGDQVIMLDLTLGPDVLFRDFAERRRTQLRKAERSGKVTVKQLETIEEIDELYQIHKIWVGSKGLAADDKANFLKMLGSNYRTTLIAACEGKIIAGTFLRYCENGIVEYAANNSLAQFRNLNANEMLGWRAIQWACERGFKKFSLGASHPFLSRFGGELTSAFRYRSDLTFFRRHANRERLETLARSVYLSLPEAVRTKLASARRKAI